ncbi:MAG TPA: hypothetical protein VFI44_07790 [Ornithinibacter sp.]|nr:hypothetical protein [Ornithinibacter sp.]
MNPGDPSGPAGRTGGVALECAARLDHRDAFGLTSPHGTLRVVDGVLSWQPDGWRRPVWHVPAGDVAGGAAGALAPFELWLETGVTGTVAVALDPPDGRWAVGGGNVPDVRGQVSLDSFVAALRAGGARIAGEPRSISSRPGNGGPVVGWPF